MKKSEKLYDLSIRLMQRGLILFTKRLNPYVHLVRLSISWEEKLQRLQKIGKKKIRMKYDIDYGTLSILGFVSMLLTQLTLAIENGTIVNYVTLVSALAFSLATVLKLVDMIEIRLERWKKKKKNQTSQKD